MLKNETKQWLLRNFFAISAIIVAITNLWLFKRLAPLSLSISQLDGRVLANEHSIELLREELVYIRNRVDNLYNLVNYH